jgi:hypothetical protein
MITINVDHPDRETELKIVHARSDVGLQESAYIVDIINDLRGSDIQTKHGLRAGIAIGRILKLQGLKPRAGDKLFHNICYDILNMETAKVQRAGHSVLHEMIDGVIHKICPLADSPVSVKKKPTKIKLAE